MEKLELNKITKKIDDKELRKLLGYVIYKNINDLYNKLKKDEIHKLFYSDYLTGDKLDKWFVKELLQNEDHIDFSKAISVEDYEELLDGINEGYLNGDIIAFEIDSLTDKYIGDN